MVDDKKAQRQPTNSFEKSLMIRINFIWMKSYCKSQKDLNRHFFILSIFLKLNL